MIFNYHFHCLHFIPSFQPIYWNSLASRIFSHWTNINQFDWLKIIPSKSHFVFLELFFHKNYWFLRPMIDHGISPEFHPADELRLEIRYGGWGIKMPLRVIFAFYLSNWTIQYLAPFVKLKPPLFDNIIDLDGYLIRVEHEKVVFDEQWWSVPFFSF